MVFQVDLLKQMFVSGVATQGSKFYECWVSSYNLLYRGHGEVWIKYTEVNIEQVRRMNMTMIKYSYVYLHDRVLSIC